ncbi:MAG: hypothetical protein IE922_03015 [Sphingomonadales bacterium]|nr:hypothetical protein [Sphingomonadales bacterium]
MLPVLPQAAAAEGEDVAAQAAALVTSEFRAWMQAPEILAALTAQNAAHAALDQAQIDALDAAWRAELDMAERPTIEPVLKNAAADYLRGLQAQAPGRIMEAFVMDARGLNVAAAQPTSDFWQGDEDKFSKTYALGAEAIHVGEVEFDESSQIYQLQVSFTISDPASGQPIGAVTLGLNAEEFH